MIPGVKELLDLFQEVLIQERCNHMCLCLPVQDALKLILDNKMKIDYNSTRYRYAYIYHFAVCHTAVVTLQASRMSSENVREFYGFMGYQKEVLDICSLGGGPGCELIGLLRARGDLGETKQINCTVIDAFSGWQHSLKCLFTAYLNSSEGSKYKEKLKYEVVRANLLSSPIRKAALEKIRSADVVTLVNFVSDIPAENRTDVLKSVFSLAKPGAYVFFLDRGSGPYLGTTSTAAKEAGLNRVYQGSLKDSISRNDLPSIGPLEITVPPLKQSNSCFIVWKKQRYRLRSQ